MRITKYAQSTFLIHNDSDSALLIDPGSYNFNGDFTPADLGRVDLLIITHRHADHFDSGVVGELLRLHNPLIITNADVAGLLDGEGIPCRIARVGERVKEQGFILDLVETDHVVRGKLVDNFGVIVTAGGVTLYHPSDTRYIEPAVLSAPNAITPDILLVPISNRGLVMGIDDAIYFTSQVKPGVVIPMHYDSPADRGRVRPEEFAERMHAAASSLPDLADVEVRILAFAESFSF